ncbi:MAG: glycosyltransferase [Sulfurovum sp.]|nr:glycosyltransferase [Sulfurovum sp.]
MKKLLYITDQDEYMDHSFIAPLFEIYLKKYLEIDIVYFTEFKSDFERKDAHRFTMPSRYKNVLIQSLLRNNIAIDSYDFIMVRNDIEVMKNVLKYRKTYGYKALYRFSYPKSSRKLLCDQAKNKNTFFAPLQHYFKMKGATSIINLCDAFLPTSLSMQKAFRPEVTIGTIVCPPAINPQVLYPNKQHEGEEKCFFYAGTVDKTRAFETVLDAFVAVNSQQWSLAISTPDTHYVHRMLEDYPQIKPQIKVYNAKTKEALLLGIALADIGVALLPDISIYNSSTPVKIFDYYASAVPCLMTHSGDTTTLFKDADTAWFSPFESEEIAKKIQSLLSLSKAEVIEVGSKGQAHLLTVQNYETIAKNIASKLQGLL